MKKITKIIWAKENIIKWLMRVSDKVVFIFAFFFFGICGSFAQKGSCFSDNDTLHNQLSIVSGISRPIVIISIVEKNGQGLFTFKQSGSHRCFKNYFLYTAGHFEYLNNESPNIFGDIEKELIQMGFSKLRVKKAIKKVETYQKSDCNFNF